MTPSLNTYAYLLKINCNEEAEKVRFTYPPKISYSQYHELRILNITDPHKACTRLKEMMKDLIINQKL